MYRPDLLDNDNDNDIVFEAPDITRKTDKFFGNALEPITTTDPSKRDQELTLVKVVVRWGLLCTKELRKDLALMSRNMVEEQEADQDTADFSKTYPHMHRQLLLSGDVATALSNYVNEQSNGIAKDRCKAGDSGAIVVNKMETFYNYFKNVRDVARMTGTTEDEVEAARKKGQSKRLRPAETMDKRRVMFQEFESQLLPLLQPEAVQQVRQHTRTHAHTRARAQHTYPHSRPPARPCPA
jgi:hypothetical protein